MRNTLHLLLTLCLSSSPTFAQSASPSPIEFRPLKTNVKASFRGLAQRGANEVWAGGSNDTVIRSMDGGKTWAKVAIPHDEVKDKDGKPVSFDYRDVELLPDGSVIVMSIGSGRASNVFRSEDDGTTWKAVLENKQPAGFFDGIAFDKSGRGILYGDPLNGRLDLYTTTDAGKTWKPIPVTNRPKLAEGEYGFAASGSGAAIDGSNLWIGTGGSVSRLHHSTDGGRNWSVVDVPLRSGNESSGIFSIAMKPTAGGFGPAVVAIGGDYLKPEEANKNVALSPDGRTWQDLSKVKMPHKACIRWLDESQILACGRTGVAYSPDGGKTWRHLSKDSWFVSTFDRKTETGFVAGRDGRVAAYKLVR